jgi:diguanylate cyclase (GGDEF)-like protein
MMQAPEFLKSILDAIKDHIVVIDHQGSVLYVNRSWNTFGDNNGGSNHWENSNYLAVCEKAARNGDSFGQNAFDGINDVINGDRREFYLEYPCNSPSEKRWFMMSATSFTNGDTTYFVISHRDITKRKIAEEEVRILSKIDPLTTLYNRRHFDEFLDLEWQRCSRLQTPISLAIIDIDHFKILNDTYGHIIGDQCLQHIAQLLKKLTQRPSDICARYGGEEFVIVYGNTNTEHAQQLLNQLLTAIRQLAIPNKNASTAPYITVSIGLATFCPNMQTNKEQLLKTADSMLYLAKENGRDQIVTDPSEHYESTREQAPSCPLINQQISQ